MAGDARRSPSGRPLPSAHGSRCASAKACCAPSTGWRAEGSEAPFVEALRALALLALVDGGGVALADDAIRRLRAVDSKAHVAYVLSALATHAAADGRPEDARGHAEEALRSAEAVGHASEAAVARSVLARLALRRGDRRGAETWLEGCAPAAACTLSVSARARAAIAEALTALEAESRDRGSGNK